GRAAGGRGVAGRLAGGAERARGPQHRARRRDRPPLRGGGYRSGITRQLTRAPVESMMATVRACPPLTAIESVTSRLSRTPPCEITTVHFPGVLSKYGVIA